MSILRWILALPIIVGAVLFALANPTIVSITYSPLHAPKELPVYFIGLSFLGTGFLFGAFMAWVGMSKTRVERRRLKKEVRQLEKDINDANENLTAALAKQKKHPIAPSLDYEEDEL